MPDARFNPDGTLRFGMAYARPYFDLSANATLLPWLETNLAVTRITGVPGFNPGPNGFGPAYGAFKDKNAGFKVRLITEEGWWPAVAVGAQDPFGTSLFPRQFAVATKTLGDTQVTLGYGRQQIDGAFGGLRYSPSWAGNWSLVSEYDALDYKNFPFAEQTHVGGRRHGISNFGRMVARDFEFQGLPLRAGDLVLLPAALYNLDERKFADPMTVDFHRPVKHHMGFGTGI